MIKIYTYPDKRFDFIKLQFESLKQFCKDEFELIIMNNGSSNERISQIESEAKSLNLMHHFIENPNHSDPTIACAYPINQTLNKFIKKEKNAILSIIMDSDMFMIQPFSFINFIEDYEISAVKQKRGDNVKYIWNGIVIINHKTIQHLDELDFGYQIINGQHTDVGGNTHFFFQKYPNTKLKNILHTSHIHPKNKNLKVLPKDLLLEYDIDFCCELYANSIFHYGRGSNWDGMPQNYHELKTEFLHKVIQKSKESNIKWNEQEYVFDYDAWK